MESVKDKLDILMVEYFKALETDCEYKIIELEQEIELLQKEMVLC